MKLFYSILCFLSDDEYVFYKVNVGENLGYSFNLEGIVRGAKEHNLLNTQLAVFNDSDEFIKIVDDLYEAQHILKLENFVLITRTEKTFKDWVATFEKSRYYKEDIQTFYDLLKIFYEETDEV